MERKVKWYRYRERKREARKSVCDHLPILSSTTTTEILSLTLMKAKVRPTQSYKDPDQSWTDCHCSTPLMVLTLLVVCYELAAPRRSFPCPRLRVNWWIIHGMKPGQRTLTLPDMNVKSRCGWKHRKAIKRSNPSREKPGPRLPNIDGSSNMLTHTYRANSQWKVERLPFYYLPVWR